MRLQELEESSGRKIRLAVEPEPMCHLSSIPRDVIPWYARLLKVADKAGQQETVREYIGLCLDVCHQAVEFEDLEHSIDQLESNGIRINKLHITNAVELQNPGNSDAGREALLSYVEPRYLHQTYARLADGTVHTRLDLTEEDIRRDPPDEFLQADCWRVHFHVPIYADTLGPLTTTRGDLEQAISRVAALPDAQHLEVETYTWPVMPGDEGAAESGLAQRIAGELHAAAQMLDAARG